jgi:DedD protein
MDERLKHRLVGLAVVLSLGAIFAPAIIKSTNQRFDEKKTISIKMPTKPSTAKVVVPNEQAMFKRMHVAHITLPAMKEEAKPLTKLAKAESISQMNDKKELSLITSNELESHEKNKSEQVMSPPELASVASQDKSSPSIVPVAKAKDSLGATPVANMKPAKPVKIASKPKAISVAKARTQSKSSPVVISTKQSKPSPLVAAIIRAKSKVFPPKNNGYSVQMGTFTQQQNALALMSTLKRKGYPAFLIKSKTSQGTVYRVLAGKTKQRDEAKLLQKKLASSVRLNGIVVPTKGLG